MGNTKLVNYLTDSVLEWMSKFFYARLVTREDSWGIPDWGVGGPSAVDLGLSSGKQPPLVAFEGDLPLVVGVLLIKSKEEEEKARSKEASPIDGGGANEQGGSGPLNGSGSFPNDGDFHYCREDLFSGSISIDSPQSLKGPTRPLFLEGAPQVIDLEEEGDPVPTSTPMGKTKPPVMKGPPASASTSMGKPVAPTHLRVLFATFEEPSSSKSNEEVFRCPFDMERRVLT
ncbi:hypothetical protein ACLOJK_022085 [Asimina triloba]